MDTSFHSDYRTFFEEHGWLVVHDVVSDEPLIRLIGVFDEVLRPHLERGMPCNEQGKSIWQLPAMCRHHEILLAHVHAGLGALVADLLNAARTQLLQDTLIVKPARVGAAIDLHQDYTYTGYLQPPSTVSVRLALTASTVETGCMYVIDRSHQWGLQGNLSVFSDRLQPGIAGRLPAKLRERVVEDCIALELNPGDASIHHCLTHHGSFENTSGTTLKTIVAHVFDGACRLAPERLPDGAIRFFDTDADGYLSPASFPVLFDRLA
jgi:ectoine hydroxylase-related dioxygenase (phytanoyl-CoA dioxygenase family)